jgi:hypothetical protein
LPPDVQGFIAARLDDAYRLALNGEESALTHLAEAARAVENGAPVDLPLNIPERNAPDELNHRPSED